MKILQLVVAVAPLFMLVASLENGDPILMTPSNGLDGKYLRNLGKQYDEELLRLLWESVNNLEEKLSEALVGCDQWSEWSKCTVSKRGQFGLKIRTRNCFPDMTVRPENRSSSVDFKACQGFCPDSYTMTKYGFCLKFVSTKAVQPVAKSACTSDGGNLVHVNSPEKMSDVVTVAQDTNSTYHWMDGKRANVSSPWYYSYETQLKWSPDWDVAEGQTGKEPDENCLAFKLDKTKHDSSCNTIYQFPYVCEITQ